jgi:sarcosine oxidase, subunit alpha
VAHRTGEHNVDSSTESVRFTLAGNTVVADRGDSYASAALLAGKRVLSRSLKYHRPRGAFCFEGHCSGCLVRINGVPNVRACQAPCRPDATIEGQNAFPSTNFDVLGAVDHVYRAGMDHHTLMTSASVLNLVVNRVVRALSGLGKLPQPSETAPAVTTASAAIVVDVDVVIIGGGPSGLAAAAGIARPGLSVLVLDEQLELGGSYLTDVRFGRPAAQNAIATAEAAGAVLLAQTTVIGYFAEPGNIRRGVIHACVGGSHARSSESTLLKINARRWLWATGGYAANLPFANNDRPGVLAARAVGRLLVAHNIVAGDRMVMIVDGNRGGGASSEIRRSANALSESLQGNGAWVQTVAVDDVASVSTGSLAGLVGHDIASIELRNGQSIACDTIAVIALPAPASEGPRMQGCEVDLDPDVGGYAVVIDARGRTSVRGAYATGDVTGYQGPAAAALHGSAIASVIVAEIQAEQPVEVSSDGR